MLGNILLSFLPYAFVTAFTPGPNNILALNTVSNYGWKKGKPIVIGIACGFLCVMIFSAFACFELAKFLPIVTNSMKFIGAAYMIWLAVHIALSKPHNKEESKNCSFWSGFILQFVNVKIILYGITIYTGYVLSVSQSFSHLLTAVFFNTLIGISGTMTWALAGAVLQKYITKYYKPFNIIMALILVWCAIKLIF